MREPKMNSILSVNRYLRWHRVVSFVLAVLLFVSYLPLPVLSVENAPQGSGQSNQNQQISSGERINNYDTLKITQDGETISELSIYEHEKIEIQANGLTENADYQWQVQHPEKDDVWVNIYDGTNQNISVTLALVSNVLRKDGTAKLRCRAYTEDYAYLSNTITVTLLTEENAAVPTMYTMPGKGQTVSTAAVRDSSEFVTITVIYHQYKKISNDVGDNSYILDKENVFSSYVATLTHNAPRPDDIECPELVGYRPEIATVTVGGAESSDAVTLSGNKISIASETITSDIVITVHYKPIAVRYQVRYFFQNIYDDLYTEDVSKMQSLSGYTGTTPDLKQDAVPGFTCLFFEPDSIAADGSTAFYVYYERNYYLMEFDCDGGYGTDTIYVRYGSYVAVPNPVKSGYVFAGWDFDSAKDENGNSVPVAGTSDAGTKDNLPSYLPAYNSSYKALWTAADTTYTVAYWIVNDDGSRSYLGGRIEESQSGTEIDGQHDLGLDDDCGAACGELQHMHTAACVSICGKEAHTHHSKHTIECYHTVAKNGGVAANDQAAINAANNADTSASEDGAAYFYFIQASHDVSAGRYWPKMLIGTEYFTVTINGRSSINLDTLNAVVDGGEIVSATSGSLTAIKYKAKADCGLTICGNSCNKAEHSHIKSCRSCNANEHTHTDNCKKDARYFDVVNSIAVTDKEGETFIYTTSQDVIIEGDGSSVVNVYYQYRKYTLKFYYAASTGSGDGIVYSIVGGSTNYFGGQHGSNTSYDTYNNSSTQDMLNRMFDLTGQLGETKTGEVPSLNERGKQRVADGTYTMGQDVSGSRTYYYFSFTARYGDDLTGKWPCDVLAPVTMAEGHTNANWTENYAVASAWNGEHHVWYSKNNYNETIKGVYEHLDYKLLYDSSFTDSTTVSYLCFWENGADGISWNIPELYRYNIYLETYSGQDLTGLTTIEKNGKTYYLADAYNTCDNSSIEEQLHPSIAGYTFKNVDRSWTAYFIANATKDDAGIYYIDGTRVYANGTVYNNNWTCPGTLQEYSLGDDKYLIYDPAKYSPDATDGIIDHRIYREAYDVNFFYDLINYKLSFWNHDDYLSDGTGSTVAFSEPLRKYFEGIDVLGVHYDGANAIVLRPEKYPSSLEPGAYYFDGWYTTPEFLEGTEVNYSAMTMPDDSIMVYAKWEPIERDVYLYLTYDDMYAHKQALKNDPTVDSTRYTWNTTDANGDPIQYPISVKHGEVLGSAYNKIPERTGYIDKNGNGVLDAGIDEVFDYIFVGWFYIDENGKKRFAPDTMQVKRDLQLFAEWRTEVDTEYTIYYKIVGENTEIAAPLTGHMSVGHTKTFEAKAGAQLFPTYQSKALFPTTSSHSVLMQPNPNENTFTFEYVEEPDVLYQVKYIDKVTGVELGSEAAVRTTNAIVSAKYKAFEGYIPEKYYITRVLTADGNATEPIPENIIVFYYIPTETTALYTVEFYQEKLDSTDPTNPANYESVLTEVYSDNIGKDITFDVDTDRFTGFSYAFNTVTSYDPEGTVTNNQTDEPAYHRPEGKLSSEGLEFRIYYSRNSFGYTIQYLEYGSSTVLGTGRFSGDLADAMHKMGTVKEHSAPDEVKFGDVTYYFYATEDKTQTQSLTFQPNTAINVLTFYYKPKEVTIYYVPVCLTPGAKEQSFGYVSHNFEILTSSTVRTCTAMPSSGFKFVGWYDNPTCSGEPCGKEREFTPDRPDNDVTYYARFEPILSSLTIQKEVYWKTGDQQYSSDNYFLFHVRGQGKTAYIDIVVSIQGNGSVVLESLPVGEYTITELTDWSWEYGDPRWKISGGGEYTDGTQAFVAVAESTVSVIFANDYSNKNVLDANGHNVIEYATDPGWLAGEIGCENVFSAVYVMN